MDFRGKLAILEAREAVAARAQRFEPASAAITHPLVGSETDGKSRLLSELRQKIAGILGQPNPRPREPADPAATVLPFVRTERAEGIVYQRIERLRPSHHVGRIPIDAARTANPALLALLAFDPLLASCAFSRALFLDLETTGLGSGAGILPFLVGLCRFDEEGRACFEQLLLRSPRDEPALIARLSECLRDAEVLVTYNGKSFDWPLLKARAVMSRAPPLPERPHLDLLHIARRLHRKRLGACRLVRLESAVLGFGRGPDIEGGEVAARYGHFLRTGDETALMAVVEHNAWDVVSMAALVGLYGEPIELLPPEDLIGLSRTLRRAGDLEGAAHAAETAVERGGGVTARQARGEVAKARGDRARALREFEAAALSLDDPKLRLELAKLYEHFVKEPERALSWVLAGTGEDEAALGRRRQRLERKAARQIPR